MNNTVVKIENQAIVSMLGMLMVINTHHKFLMVLRKELSKLIWL